MIIANYFNGWLESMWQIRSASLHCRNVTEVNQVLQNGHICLCKWPCRGLCPKAMLCCWFPEVGREGSLYAFFSSIGHTVTTDGWTFGGLEEPPSLIILQSHSKALHNMFAFYIYTYIYVCVCVCVCVWNGMEIELGVALRFELQESMYLYFLCIHF